MAIARLFRALLAVSAGSALTIRDKPDRTPPSATTTNGTYVGRYEPAYDEDYFLGIPFAQRPLGDLRFRAPKSLNESWSGTRNATEYSPECIGYEQDTWSQGNCVSEDCLTLNVVRTTDYQDKLPVLVWFHGGALVMGGSADRRYNQSFIVQQATEAGMPIVAVSVNYRLQSWFPVRQGIPRGRQRHGWLQRFSPRSALDPREHRCVWRRPCSCHDHG